MTATGNQRKGMIKMDRMHEGFQPVRPPGVADVPPEDLERPSAKSTIAADMRRPLLVWPVWLDDPERPVWIDDEVAQGE